MSMSMTPVVITRKDSGCTRAHTCSLHRDRSACPIFTVNEAGSPPRQPSAQRRHVGVQGGAPGGQERAFRATLEAQGYAFRATPGEEGWAAFRAQECSCTKQTAAADHVRGAYAGLPSGHAGHGRRVMVHGHTKYCTDGKPRQYAWQH